MQLEHITLWLHTALFMQVNESTAVQIIPQQTNTFSEGPHKPARGTQGRIENPGPRTTAGCVTKSGFKSSSG